MSQSDIVFSTYPMAFHTPGGGEVQLMAYRKHLEACGVSVRLMDPWNPRFLECKLVHFFSCVGGSIHFCNFVKKLGLPLVITSSLWVTEETRHLYPVDEIRAQLQLADRIVTNSEMESDTLSRVLNISRDRFYVVYNGVDPVFLERPGPELFRHSQGIESPFVLNVGNVEPRKNQHVLAKAMHAFPDHKLVLIGHVREQSYLQQTLQAGLPGQVVYLGPQPHESDTLRSAYQACDVCCLSSTLETPGLAALEAAAQGRPLALTEVGSTREYFGTAAAYLRPSNPQSIAQAINQALQQTPEQLVKLAQLGASFVWPNVVTRLKELYEQF
jgi:glycosyltransferase involved in cell wall biosynthesis